MSPLFLEDYDAFLNKVLPLESKNRIVQTNRFSKNICKLKYIFIVFFLYKLFTYFKKKMIPFKTLLLNYYYKNKNKYIS